MQRHTPRARVVDDYFVDRELTPKDENGDYDFESLHALNLPLLNKQLMQLFNGEEVELPKYDFIKGRSVPSGKKMRMRAGDVLVIEGIHALNPELTSQIPEEYKYRVYASALTTILLDDHTTSPPPTTACCAASYATTSSVDVQPATPYDVGRACAGARTNGYSRSRKMPTKCSTLP